MHRIYIIIAILVTGCFALCGTSYGQIVNQNFVNNSPPGSGTQTGQTNNQQQDEEVIMSTKPSFTIKRYFKALAHKDSMKVSHMAIGSIILPGTAQIYNKDYWKLPLVYGSIGGCVAGAVTSKEKSSRNWFIAGAIACWWGSALDGVYSYKSNTKPLPARASMLSALVPGLGQAYNGDYWKIPIFYTGLGACVYALSFNQTQYDRYREIYIAQSEGTYTGNLSVDNIKWYRDQYRRYRDYSIIATVLVYALNIIDANVFAHFSTFDISDDISFNVEPALIQPITPQTNTFAYNSSQFGLQMNLKF